MKRLLYIDLFCGAGGTSTGVNSARLGGQPCAEVIACVNHDAKAIASHAANQRIMKDFRGSIDGINADLINHILRQIFGSKCLPDKGTDCTPVDPKSVERLINTIKDSMEHPLPDKMLLGDITKPKPLPSENFCQVGPFRDLPNSVETAASTNPLSQYQTENCDNENRISTDCDKPAKPKFKKGDSVKYVGKEHPEYWGEVFTVDGEIFYNDYHKEMQIDSIRCDKYNICNVALSDLVLYTEPEEEADKHFDAIVKDSFSKERRLNIAAMAMQGLLANPNNNASLRETIADALNCADTLLHEVEKGGSK